MRVVDRVGIIVARTMIMGTEVRQWKPSERSGWRVLSRGGLMSMLSAPIKPTHKAIQAYYEKLKGYGAQDVSHEMGLRSAFQHLLEETGQVCTTGP